MTSKPHRWFVTRLLVTLVLGIGAWWAVGRWLEPKPVWIVPTGQAVIMPLVEWPEQDLLVVQTIKQTERTIRPWANKSILLQLLDRRTGEVRKSISLEQQILVYLGDAGLPRERHGIVWWLQDDCLSCPRTYQLMRWDYQHDQEVTVVARWTNDWPWLTTVHWPQGSDVFTVELKLRWSWIPLMHNSHHYGLLLLGKVHYPFDQKWQFNLAQSYRLPLKAGEPPVKLVHWSMHERDHTQYACVEGRSLLTRLVSRDMWQPSPMNRAQALGKPTLTPAEIARCFLGESNRVQVMDLATGRELVELPAPEKGFYESVYWSGPYLITNIGEWWSTQPMSMAELGAQQDKDPEVLWPTRMIIYRWNGQTLESLNIEDMKVWRERSNAAKHHRQIANKIDMKQNERIISWISSSSIYKSYDSSYLINSFNEEEKVVTDPSGTQVIINQLNQKTFPAVLQSWAVERKWLKTLLDWFDPMACHEAVIHSGNQQHSPYRLSHQLAMNCKYIAADLSSLYTMSFRFQDKQVEYTSLHCYALPIAIYSPWWPRSAGLLTALVCWLLLTRRARRGAA